MAKRFNNLFEQIVSFDALYRAYLLARRGKRETMACRYFEKNLEGELIQLQNELIWGEYRTGPYRSFYVNEPKRRKITALVRFRDRVVQHAIYAVIEPIWEKRFISDSFACRPGKGTHAGANRAQAMLSECLRRHGQIYVLKADVRKYFPSIDHEALLGLVRKRIKDPRMLDILEDIIRSYSEPGAPGKGLPIGSLISQLLANVNLDPFDQWVKCRRQEAWYTRYMDDFVLIHPDKRHLQAFRIDAERWLSDNLLLETNHKTSVFPIAHQGGRGLDFLGYHLWPDGRRMRRASLRRFSRQLKQWQSLYARGDIGLPQIRESLHSWVNHAHHGNALKAISSMLNNTTFRRNSDEQRTGNRPGNGRIPSRNAPRVGASQKTRNHEGQSVSGQSRSYAEGNASAGSDGCG